MARESGPPAARAAACAAALAGLPGAGPASLTRLLVDAGDPVEAWERVLAGRSVRPPGREVGRRVVPWDVAARRVDVDAAWTASASRGVQVTWLGAPTYPAALAADPLPPPVLFWRGDLGRLEARRVAVVGTRRCTPDGAATAFGLGRDLAGAGLCVVSGLALGVDGAAHRGALASRGPGSTVGVAASGVDRAYPRSHAALWEEVVGAGAVLSETPPGYPAQAWRFPARNRIIAGLAELVVVVESHAAGGSLLTVDAALERGIEVGVVPGPVRCPASAGTNQLLSDGSMPVRGAADVLDALGLFGPAPAATPAGPPAAASTGALPAGVRQVLEVVGWRPTSFNSIVGASGLGVGVAAAALDELRVAGLVVEERGWWQRTAGATVSSPACAGE